MTRLIAGMFSQVAEVDDLVTVGQACSPDQPQGPKDQASQEPFLAVARLLASECFGEEGTGQVRHQDHDHQLPFHGEGRIRSDT